MAKWNRNPSVRADLSEKSVNDVMADRTLVHQIDLQRLGEGEGDKVVRLLRDAEKDIQDQLYVRLARIQERGVDLGPVTTRRLREMEQSIGKIVDEWGKESYKVLRNDLVEVGRDEMDFQQSLFDKTLPVKAELVLPSRQTLRAIVTTEPFDGAPLRQWFNRMEGGVKTNLNRAIRLGMVEGETVDQIARRIRGTQRQNYADGLLYGTAQQSRALARTGTNHISNRAREHLFNENSDIVKAVQWLATLDSRTCFTAGTNVLTRTGNRPIEEIEVGEEVFTHRHKWQRVIETKQRVFRGAIWEIESEGDRIKSTSDHLFLTERGWRPLDHLGQWDRVIRLSQRRGDAFLDGFSAVSTGSFHASNIKILSRVVKDCTVYNLDVEEDHSYIANGFVVHNCPQCMALDQKVYPLGEPHPQPPAHVQCRCTIVPVLKSWRELGIQAKELPASTRASMNGQVAGTISYPKWLKGQTEAVQNRALGPARAKLWRSGKIKVEQFVAKDGSTLTLEQLQKIEKRPVKPSKPSSPQALPSTLAGTQAALTKVEDRIAWIQEQWKYENPPPGLQPEYDGLLKQQRLLRKNLKSQSEKQVAKLPPWNPKKAIADAEKWAEGVGPEDYDVIDDWVTDRYEEIREDQEEGNKKGHGWKMGEKLKKIVSGAPKWRGDMYRGLTFLDDAERAQFIDNLVQAKGLKSKSFQSFDRTRAVGEKFATPTSSNAGVLLRVKGKTARMIEHLSVQKSEDYKEFEVLALPNTEYRFLRIVGTKRKGPGSVTVIDLEEI